MNPYMQFMNPFPNQGNPMQNQQSYPHSSYEAMPPQFRGYPEGYHPFYHPPCGSSGVNGFAYPSQYYGCCNHNFFPSYCPPQPPSMPYGHHHYHPTHCCGGYSVPPGAQHPCQLSPLFPTMGPMQFEYQKDNPYYQQRSDCPNDMWKRENCLKIEGPRTEPKGDTSVVPSDFKNSPHPFVLVPPNYINDNSSGKRNESTCDRQEGFFRGDQPRFLNGWLPVDIDKSRSSEQMDDDSGRKMHKDNERPYFPLPFFYMPYQANDMGTMEQMDVGQQCPRGVSVEQMDDHPLSPIHGDTSKNKSNDRIIVCQDPRMMEPKKVDDIPSERKGEGKTAQTTEVKSDTSTKRVGVDNEAKKASGDGKRKMSSPAKSSKLPPVCLRVDPLPKKKKGCSPSKPSSPPDEKNKSGDSFKDGTKSKVSVSPDGAKISLDDTSIEQPKRKVKTIKVFDASSQPREDVRVSNINSRNADEDRSADQPNHTRSEKNEDKDASKETLPALKLPGDSKRRELSEDVAAKIIQSAYRGYEERKWEPLKKLKNIKAVRDEFNQLKKQIDALECTQDNTLLDKSRTVIGESIMNLLLKLDSIQGLPPNVRQVRKSLARDLMSLQDQLDALGQKQTEKTIPSALLAKSEEEVQTAEGACVQDDQEKNCLLLESGNEIEEKDKNKNHEESPLTEISVEEENGIHKENVPDEVECHSTQLNEEYSQDVSSNAGNLESGSMPQSVHDAQRSGVDQSGKEDCEDKLDYVPNMGPAELQEQVPLEPGENKYGDDNGLPEQTPSISKMSNLVEVGDQNRQETIDEAPGDYTSDLNASDNTEPVSEPVQVCEDVKDLSLTNNNEKVDDPVPESVAESTNVMENTGWLQDQNESIELDDECYKIPADITTLQQEQKLADGSLEMLGHPSELVLESEQANLETDEGKIEPISSSQPSFTVTESGLPEQTPSILKMSNLIEVGDQNRQETVDEAPGDDTSDLNEASVNVDPVSEDPVTEPVQVCEDVQDSCSTNNNEKADDPVTESVAKSTNVMENSGRVQDQNESIELHGTRCVPCEESAVVADKDYEVPADIAASPQEQIQADGSPEKFGHPSEPVLEYEETNPGKETGEAKFIPISSSQPGFTDTDRSLIEENERLKEQLQKIIEAGQEQLSAISSLSKKVRDLERKLHRKKKVKMCRSRGAGSRSSCYKMSMDDELPSALAN